MRSDAKYSVHLNKNHDIWCHKKEYFLKVPFYFHYINWREKHIQKSGINLNNYICDKTLSCEMEKVWKGQKCDAAEMLRGLLLIFLYEEK